jgi:hypothetical protein
MSKLLACLMLSLLPLAVGAAPKPIGPKAPPVPPNSTSYSLYEDTLKFYAPADWPVMLKKTEGVPQFIAFQVKDPADEGSGEASEVTVEAKLLNEASTFQALVNAGTDKAKQTPGFEQRSDGVEPSTLRYYGLNGKTRYEYRETWYLDSKILIHVRCARPLLAATSAAWTSAYEQGCAQIMQSIKPH